MRSSLGGLSHRQLRRWVLLFFAALALPTAALVFQAYNQLKWESFHQHRLRAEEVGRRIDARLNELMLVEEKRSSADYLFLRGRDSGSLVDAQLSDLSRFPVASAVPGLLSYFQIDSDGSFSTPLLPDSAQWVAQLRRAGSGLEDRLHLQNQVRKILGENQLVTPDPVRRSSATELTQTRDKPAARAGRDVSDISAGTGSTDATNRRSKADKDAVAAAKSAPSRGSAPPAPTASEASAEASAEAVSMTRPAARASSELLTRKRSVPTAGTQTQRAEPVASQRAFDALQDESSQNVSRAGQRGNRLGSVAELKLEAPYREKLAAQLSKERAQRLDAAPEVPRQARREQFNAPSNEPSADHSAVPMEESLTPAAAQATAIEPEAPIRTFDADVDPFEFRLLNSGHFVMFRKVWRQGARTIQGAVLDQRLFFEGAFEQIFRLSSLASMSNLALAYQGQVLQAFSGNSARGYLDSAAQLSGSLLYETRLSAPLSQIQLLFTATSLPAGPGASVIAWTAGLLSLLLPGGLYLLYRLGAKQIDLASQQQDFVSAVSHELKTPLTSIRMYGELLREGWASEEKKRTYYDYICDESERLSRLITNVLQLARMTRNELQAQTRTVSLAELSDTVRSKITSQVERAGFEAQITCSDQDGTVMISVDPDFFIQIVINLVDNALKFSAQSAQRQVHLSWALSPEQVSLRVRDFGPGIAPGQLKRIFGLFYRANSELTRDTVGTGIGLALVAELARAMDATVDVINQQPGAEFRVSFQRASP